MKAGDFSYIETYLSSELYDTQFSLHGTQLYIEGKCVFWWFGIVVEFGEQFVL